MSSHGGSLSELSIESSLGGSRGAFSLSSHLLTPLLSLSGVSFESAEDRLSMSIEGSECSIDILSSLSAVVSVPFLSSVFLSTSEAVLLSVEAGNHVSAGSEPFLVHHTTRYAMANSNKTSDCSLEFSVVILKGTSSDFPFGMSYLSAKVVSFTLSITLQMSDFSFSISDNRGASGDSGNDSTSNEGLEHFL